MDITMPDWSTLEKDLLIYIAERLDTLGDRLRFRSVCKSFQSIIPSYKPLSPPRSDLKIRFPYTKQPYSGGHFLLTYSTVFEIRPLGNTHETNNTWLVRAQKLCSGKVRLRNPLFDTRYHFHFSNDSPNSLNLLDYHVKEIDKAHHLDLVTPPEGKLLPDYFSKVIVSSCDGENDDAFSIMVLHNDGSPLVWRNREKQWTILEFDRDSIRDIAYYDKKFYLLVSNCVIESIDPYSLAVNEAVCVVSKELPDPLFLAIAFGDLLMVGIWASEFMHVYKVDVEKRNLVLVKEGWENRMLFLSDYHSFSVLAEEFSGREGNCLYFCHYDYGYHIDNRPGRAVGVYHFEQGYNAPQYFDTFLPPPDWFY